MSTRFRALGVAAALLLLGPGPAAAQRAGATVKAARADFADMAKGSYVGEIVETGGSPRATARLTVVKAGPNQVRVTSDDPRLAAFTARLTRTADAVRNVGGDALFALDLSKSPRTLTVAVGGASWTGVRQ
jgi:hypothetical protein